MRAIERVLSLLNGRRVRDNEYRAKCPVHQGRSPTSLAIQDAGDRVLIHCFAGCSIHNILRSLGIESARELFDSQTEHDLYTSRRIARVRSGQQVIEQWAETRLLWVCSELRHVDAWIGQWVSTLAEYEGNQECSAGQDAIWNALAKAYNRRTDLEAEFEVLNGRSLSEKIALYRMVMHAD